MATIFTDDIHYKNIANAIRAKNGSTDKYTPLEMSAAIKAIKTTPVLQEKTIIPSTSAQEIIPDSGYDGLSKVTVNGDADLLAANIKKDVEIFGVTGTYESSNITATVKDVNFYDYDGTLLYSYTLEEAQALTELPALPTREGLTCQGWNYDLATIKSYDRKVNVGATYITDDGTTRIYIKLEDGRTSPMLGVCPNGTVDVDWGDGTAHDTLTGTDTTVVQWTPTHNYASAGEYVIKLTVTGSMGFYGSRNSNQYSAILRYSSGEDTRNYVYRNAVQKVEIGNSVTRIGNYAFYICYSLSSIVIPNSVTSIGNYAFADCDSLSSIVIPNSVTSIGTRAFLNCYSLSSIVIPNSVTSIGNSAFQYCYSLSSIVIPNSVTSIGNSAFQYCYSLSSIVIPNSVTSIGGSAFHYCCSMAYYDFTAHTSVPTLANTNAFAQIPADCQIRVPAALYDSWKSATNWSTYADHIVGV